MDKVSATYLTSNAMDWIHLAPHGMAFQVTPDLLRAYLAKDVDWGDWKPSLQDDGVAEPVESYGEPIAVRHDTDPVEILDPETWARRLAFHEVDTQETCPDCGARAGAGHAAFCNHWAAAEEVSHA